MTSPTTQVLDLDDNTDLTTLPETTVVKVYATWCGPCRLFGPIFERSAARYPQLTFAQVDIDAAPALREAFEIQSVPAIRAIRQGQIVDSMNWPITPKSFSAFLDTQA